MQTQSVLSAIKAFFSRIAQLVQDPVACARADEEAYLSQAVDLVHLEALQRQWDRRHQSGLSLGHSA